MKKDVVAKEQYDETYALAKSLENTIQLNQAVLERSQLDKEYAEIRAPHLRARGHRSRSTRAMSSRPTTTAPLCVINQLEPIHVSFSVPERHLPRILARGDGPPPDGGGPGLGERHPCSRPAGGRGQRRGHHHGHHPAPGPIRQHGPQAVARPVRPGGAEPGHPAQRGPGAHRSGHGRAGRPLRLRAGREFHGPSQERRDRPHRGRIHGPWTRAWPPGKPWWWTDRSAWHRACGWRSKPWFRRPPSWGTPQTPRPGTRPRRRTAREPLGDLHQPHRS